MIRDLLTVLKSRQQREPQPLVWTPDLVARFWDGVWTTRLKEFSFARQAGRSLIVAVDHLLPPGTRVLDFGAGVGDLTELLLQRDLQVAAHETSPAGRTALAQRFHGRRGFLGSPTPRDRAEFDVVILAEVIEHVLDGEFDATLTLVSARTRPGGLVIVTTPNNEDLELGMCVDPLSNVVFHRWQHVRSFTRATLSACMRRYGLEAVVTHELEFSEARYLPFDRLWAPDGHPQPPQPHLVSLRADRDTYDGARQNLVFVGQRRS